MLHVGDITLPDGRIVHGRIVTTWERDTNAVNIRSCALEWPDGIDLTLDEYDEDLGGVYLHEYVIDELLKKKPEKDH